jgi:hypothetical protein
MSELFNIPDSKSPRLRWMDMHGVWTRKTQFVDFVQEESAWTAEAAGRIGTGPTEDDAIVDLAKKMKIRLWNEL